MVEALSRANRDKDDRVARRVAVDEALMILEVSCDILEVRISTKGFAGPRGTG